jgi:N-acetylglutamate synthase-like GNAT family acetyltransferase
VIEIEHARAGDRPEIEGLLEAGLLPTDGFELALGTAVVAREDGRIVGCAAIEPYGSVALLRSVCVAPGRRGIGLGRRLVERVEGVATALEIAELFLLTETAADWFARRGYEPDAREAAPAALLGSPEFTGACPVSAALFRKRLDRAAPVA